MRTGCRDFHIEMLWGTGIYERHGASIQRVLNKWSGINMISEFIGLEAEFISEIN